MTNQPSPDTVQESLSERYEVRGLLGQGGMAKVFRAFDRVRKHEVALKQLTVAPNTSERTSVAALFEREFQTLAQLRHPNVIEVYDYFLPADAGPYYTMELLDGGDLLERTPMPWRDACAVMVDVCSSLALLHSRGLLHRDISPRNIHETQAGKAKLIDFGAMGPMSPGGAQVVGTPAFCAPETLHKLALDARTDLYSLGVTLYYVLTGGLPYPGRTFADMLLAWTAKVVPPSVLKSELPAALDDLVLQLIHPEPELRPASAYVVLQRLQAIAGLPPREADTVQQAYLVTPTLVGRAALLDQLRKQLVDARLRKAGGALIQGASGSGRSRLLDACALEAKTLGFHVLRAVCTGSSQVFGVAQALVQHLLEASPQAASEPDAAVLFEARARADEPPIFRRLSAAELDPSAVQRAFCQLLLRLSRSRPLLLAVDDIHRIDPPSAAVLAALLDSVEGQLFVALTNDSSAPQSEAQHALARRCQLLEPAPLTHAETQQLLASLFGDVPHLANLTDEIFKLASGNPRVCIALAQHLLDRGIVRYDAGIWILPSSLSAKDLPRDASAALQARIERLSPEARWLAEAHALAFFETLRDQDYHALRPDLSSAQVEHALAELLAMQVLVRDGQRYSLANRAWSHALRESLSPNDRAARHCALMSLHAGTLSTAELHHAFCAGLDEVGLDLLVRRHAQYDAHKRLDLKTLVDEDMPRGTWVYDPAIATAIRLGRPRRVVNELRRWRMAGLITTEWGAHTEMDRLWFEQLAHDSGLSFYRADTQAKPEERLTRALQSAYERYQQTPEAERVYAVDEAIRLLAEYVVYSIALGGRAGDMSLLRELPSILEPFAVFSPVLDAIWNNAIATYDSAQSNFEAAHRRWSQVLAKLDAMSGSDMTLIEPIRNAVIYALSLSAVQLGLKSAEELAARLDADPYQNVGGLALRQVVRLQQGDYRGAATYRRRAELLSLELRWPQMFKSQLLVEVWTYGRIGDLVGLRDAVERLRDLATHFPGWVVSVGCAEGAFHGVRGDFQAAKATFEECLKVATTDEQGSYPLGVWLAAQCGVADSLFELGRFEEAQREAAIGVELCQARKLVSASVDLVRCLALAEGKLGHPEAAAARLDALIAQQQELGTTGLRIGLSYEARARIALWSGDAQGFEHFARLTAQEYRHGARSPLGARYERLLNEAKRIGIRGAETLPELAGSSLIASNALLTQDLLTIIARNMTGKSGTSERAEAALSLLCSSRNATIGHLYLCTDSGLVLCASRGPVADDALADAAADFLNAGTRRTEAISDMVTGELEEHSKSTMIQSQDVRYELLLLSCLIEGKNTPVAVAAVPESDAAPDSLRQAQLLQVLATHLRFDATSLR